MSKVRRLVIGGDGSVGGGIKFEMLEGTSDVPNRRSAENNRSGQVSFIFLN